MLDIRHHERVQGHPFRWHVHLRGREHPLVVELPPEEREGLDLTDEQIHDLLPTALQRREELNRDDTPLGEDEPRAQADAPVRVYQTHFMG